jgi:hypothetical protein
MRSVHIRGFIRSVSVIKDILPIRFLCGSEMICSESGRIHKNDISSKFCCNSGQVFPPTLSNHKEIKRSTCIQAQDKREEHMEEMIKRIKQHEVYIAEVSKHTLAFDVY